MKEYQLPFKVSDLATLSTFISNVEKLFISGSVYEPYSNIPHSQMSGQDLWRRALLHGKVPKLNHWVNLGFPYSQVDQKQNMIYDYEEVIQWTQMMYDIINFSAFRINKPMPKKINIPPCFKTEEQMIGRECFFPPTIHKKVIYTDAGQNTCVIEDGDKIIIRGNIHWTMETRSQERITYRAEQGWMWWSYLNWYKLFTLSDRLSFMFGISRNDLFNAECFIPEDQLFESYRNGMNADNLRHFIGIIEPYLKPFKTYRPYVNRGFINIKDNSVITQHEIELNRQECLQSFRSRKRRTAR